MRKQNGRLNRPLAVTPLVALALAGCGDDATTPATTPADTSSPAADVSPGTDTTTEPGTDTATGTDTAAPTLPPQVECTATVCRVSAPINDPVTASFTMTADKQWLLEGGVFIGDDSAETVLTIEPGTTVYGETASKAFLTIRRGSRIEAAGTAEKPIVFTSSKSPGQRARGDWGGLVINGRAPVNGCETAPCESEGEGGTGQYGGGDAADSSGTLRYVRVEFAGFPITEDNELNGVAFQGVGAGTEVDHLQVHMAKDDGVEFFGGTVNVKHVVLTGISDDNIDWTDGWTGKAQFVLVQQYEDAGDNGIEADNNGDNNDALPRSAPMLANLTIIGVPEAASSDLGVLLREGTAAHLHDSVVLGWNEACFDIDHSATFALAKDGEALSGELMVKNTILSCAKTFVADDEKNDAGEAQPDPWSVEAFLFTLNSGNKTVDPDLTKPFDTAAPDARPKAGSPALTGAATPSDAFFTSVPYVGAFDATNDWTAGWITTSRN
jgi:hypothetical protein